MQCMWNERGPCTMRYDRQELIIGQEGQDKLKNATVAIIGVGALGTVATELLARSGVGKLILIDRSRCRQKQSSCCKRKNCTN